MSDVWSRRDFAKSAALAAAAAVLPQAGRAQAGSALTAAQVVEQIKQALHMSWDAKTYRDTFKAGDPNTPVKGVAACFMDTLDVLKRAQRQGLNFVITHEPTYWTDADLQEPIKADSLYLQKLRFVQDNGMVVWRIHDHWHRVAPEPMQAGNNELLKWPNDPADPRVDRLPPTKLRAVAEQVAQRLYSRSVRIVGDPEMRVETVARGGHTLGGNIAALQRADVALSFEVREWESVEYARDLIASGARKGMIVIAHEVGEEAGMELFTRWMNDAVPGVTTRFVPTHDRMYLV